MKVKKLLKSVLSLSVIVCLSLLLFEACYRLQIIDFYQTEFEYLNQAQINEPDKTVFILGDSFTASKDTYVNQLRANFPKLQFINAAVPGTGIRQHQLLFEKHAGAKADILLYQFYVGNDFLDLNYPINFNATSTAKILYKKLSEHLLSLHYLNYQLAYFRSNEQSLEGMSRVEFESKTYNSRQKQLFKADPNSLKNTIQLKGKQKQTYQVWKEKFKEITDEFGSDKAIYLLVIPHVAQLNSIWLSRMKDLGANLNQEDLATNFALINQLQKDFTQIELINPLAEFKSQNARGVNLYFQNDPHLNAAGQKVLGDYLVKQFESKLVYEN